MSMMLNSRISSAAIAITAAAFLLAGCQSMTPMMAGEKVSLSGSNEVPPVAGAAAGSGTVTIAEDRSVKAHITVTGMTATAAHIHEAAAGANGPVIVPFTKTADNVFDAPDGAKVTEAQYASYKAGKLYVNVHSAKNPGGEVRAQLKGN